MKMTCSRVVAIALLTVIALVFAIAATVSAMEAIHDVWIESRCVSSTSEGPDHDYTFTWYLFRALDIFDSLMNRFCKAIHREDLFFMWRIWLMENYSTTIY